MQSSDGSATGALRGHNDTLAKPFAVGQLADKLAVHLGLTWVHEGEEKHADPTPVTRPLMRPDANHLEELIRLGEIGYVRGIEAKLTEIALQPRFVVAVVCGVASYSMMNMVMTSAPLAMVMCNHSVTEATLGLHAELLRLSSCGLCHLLGNDDRDGDVHARATALRKAAMRPGQVQPA